MMNTENPLLGSAHRDVLEAPIPDSASSKAALVSELQSRGRAAVGSKSWPDAKMLYEKAISICDACSKDDAAAMPTHVSVFHANLSLVLRNMGEWEPSRKAADDATTSDPSYVKGWWRLGQALQSLHRQSDALAALDKALQIEPENKALKKEREKVAKLVQEEKAAMEAAAAASSSDDRDPAPMQVEKPAKKQSSKATTTKTTTSTKASPATSTKTSDKMDVDEDDDSKIFSKSDAVRGYKIVNGKKTSYFHNELSEEAKTLIGDIAPKKLDVPVAPTPQDANDKSGTSAWNKAGTWEEKDVTNWATASLKEQIMQATCVLPDSCGAAAGALVSVSSISSVDGHASVAVARGKKRFIYEFAVKGVKWSVTGASSPDFSCEGKLNIPDIDGTIEIGEGYEIDGFTIDELSDGALRSKIDKAVRKGEFHEALNESIDDWVRLFRDTYS